VIPEAEVERAVDYLRDSAEKAAMCRATRHYLAEWLKSKRAMLQAQKIGDGLGASEVFALGHPEYQQALNDYRVAVEQDERHRFLREAAVAKIDFYRTQCANERGAMKV
jgi:hypothetical protein